MKESFKGHDYVSFIHPHSRKALRNVDRLQNIVAQH